MGIPRKLREQDRVNERVVGETLRERMERQDYIAKVPSPGPWTVPIHGLLGTMPHSRR